MIALLSAGITLIARPHRPDEFVVGLCLTLDVVGLIIWWLRRTIPKASRQLPE